MSALLDVSMHLRGKAPTPSRPLVPSRCELRVTLLCLGCTYRNASAAIPDENNFDSDSYATLAGPCSQRSRFAVAIRTKRYLAPIAALALTSPRTCQPAVGQGHARHSLEYVNPTCFKGVRDSLRSGLFPHAPASGLYAIAATSMPHKTSPNFAYARREILMRALLRKSMDNTIRQLTGDEDASMSWCVRGYHKKIYVKYGLELRGWPDGITFTNLSDVTGYEQISTLFVLWQTGVLSFVPAGLDKAARAKQRAVDVAPSAQNKGIPPQLGRSDLKKHKGSKRVDPIRFPPRYERNGPKSERWVTAEAEARAEIPLAATRRTGARARAPRWMATGAEDPSDPITLFEDEAAAARGARRTGGRVQGRCGEPVYVRGMPLRME